MKNIESFEFRIGWGGIDETKNQVNSFIRQLMKKGIVEVEINITGTGDGLVYTLIWEE